MKTAHLESAFEGEIVAHMTAHGWANGDRTAYRRDLGLDPGELLAFVRQTQPEAWDRLVGLHGNEAKASQRLLKRVADELSSRGTVDVLRRGVVDLSVPVALLFAEPAHELTSELRDLFEANRCAIVRQLAHSESNPTDAVDLALLVNGIPVATAELKTPTTGQDVRDAVEQYREDRNPKDLIFAGRALVHFAVDPNSVEMTTELAGVGTVFRPFNLGSGGPGEEAARATRATRTVTRRRTCGSRCGSADLARPACHLRPRREAHRDRPAHRQAGDAPDAGLPALPPVARGSDAATHGANRWAGPLLPSAALRRLRQIATRSPGSLTGCRDSTRRTPGAPGPGPDVPMFDKIVVITDRVVLDRQLQATVTGFSHTPGSIVRIGDAGLSASCAQRWRATRPASSSPRCRSSRSSPGSHRSCGDALRGGRRRGALLAAGDAAKKLKEVLGRRARRRPTPRPRARRRGCRDAAAASRRPGAGSTNLSFFAFTATPKPKTLELFGERTPSRRHRAASPFHLYSMRQAIEEGFILDVLRDYTTYSTYYGSPTALGDDPEVRQGARRRRRWPGSSRCTRTNLAQKAEIIVEHFRAQTARARSAAGRRRWW